MDRFAALTSLTADRSFNSGAQMVTVLVVEDEALIRMNLAIHLEDEGFEVFEAANADQAIELMEQHESIHVLFTDLNMPGSMDGLMLTAYVKNRWPPVRIMMTSGKRVLEVTDLPAGGVFFAKPYQLASVTNVIRELLAS
jgi:CheY-like chemotaxis protein